MAKPKKLPTDPAPVEPLPCEVDLVLEEPAPVEPLPCEAEAEPVELAPVEPLPGDPGYVAPVEAEAVTVEP